LPYDIGAARCLGSFLAASTARSSWSGHSYGGAVMTEAASGGVTALADVEQLLRRVLYD
jgi:hypothetical protein